MQEAVLPNPLIEGLSDSRTAQPHTIVIFGGTGDLTARKLIPAIFELNRGGYIPARSAIIGLGRRDKDDSEFRDDVGKALRKFARTGPPTDAELEAFVGRVYYFKSSYMEEDAYPHLRERIQQLENKLAIPPNRLFYLATTPDAFPFIIEHLSKSGLVKPPGATQGWQRVVIEKPFGHDLASARELNALVNRSLHESQAFRIDHYLGKETVQNILALRFANEIFEPLWNRRHVASVQITVSESIGMEGRRGAYYDTAGVLRDMIQNHVLQLLCLTAMEPPASMEAESIRNEKVKVLQTLIPMNPDEVRRNVVRGQYGAGSLLGKSIKSYRDEEGVAPDSKTETFVALRARLDNWRWADVPFYLRSGKRLPKRASEIALEFRHPPKVFLGRAADSSQQPNFLVIRIQPDEGISLLFHAKTPGMRFRIQSVKMDFRYGTSFGVANPEAYERLLLDALTGDSTLFTRNDEIDAAWEFITSIHEGWDAEPPPQFPNYEPGTWGPNEADRLIEESGTHWRKL